MRLEKEAGTKAPRICTTVRILGFCLCLDFHLTQTTVAGKYAHMDIHQEMWQLFQQEVTES